MKNNTQIISVDECSIYLEMTPDYGWSIKNNPCEFLVKKKKYRRISVLIAINKYKMVDYMVKEGSINKFDYEKFIKKITRNRNNVAILQDNAAIHTSLLCKQLYKNNNINIIFNVPYMPEFNPVEYLNNKIKCYIKRCPNSTLKLLKDGLKLAISTITRKDTINFFNKSLTYNLNNVCKNTIHNS